MARCEKCERIVDTDIDCGFYDFAYKVNDMGGHCEWCRDEFMDAMNDTEQAAHENRIYG